MQHVFRDASLTQMRTRVMHSTETEKTQSIPARLRHLAGVELPSLSIVARVRFPDRTICCAECVEGADISTNDSRVRRQTSGGWRNRTPPGNTSCRRSCGYQPPDSIAIPTMETSLNEVTHDRSIEQRQFRQLQQEAKGRSAVLHQAGDLAGCRNSRPNRQAKPCQQSHPEPLASRHVDDAGRHGGRKSPRYRMEEGLHHSAAHESVGLTL